MSKIPIESGIPIPIPSCHRGQVIRYPFHEMKIGDSFFIADVPKSFSIYSLVRNYNEKNGREIRVTQRRESNGVRVWRIA